MTISKGIQSILSAIERVPTFSYLSPHVNFRTHIELDSDRAASFPRSAVIFVEKYTVEKLKRFARIWRALHRAGRFYPSKKNTTRMHGVTCDKCALCLQHLTIVKLCLSTCVSKILWEKFYAPSDFLVTIKTFLNCNRPLGDLFLICFIFPVQFKFYHHPHDLLRNLCHKIYLL